MTQQLLQPRAGQSLDKLSKNMNDSTNNLLNDTLPSNDIPVDPSGFYRLDPGGEILHGPNFVYGPDFSLLRELKDTYSYPVNGWSWFDTLEAAQAALLA